MPFTVKVQSNVDYPYISPYPDFFLRSRFLHEYELKQNVRTKCTHIIEETSHAQFVQAVLSADGQLAGIIFGPRILLSFLIEQLFMADAELKP